MNRGLLTYMNSEADLAAVLAHEIAHITARHAVQQQARGALARGAAQLPRGDAVARGDRRGQGGAEDGDVCRRPAQQQGGR